MVREFHQVFGNNPPDPDSQIDWENPQIQCNINGIKEELEEFKEAFKVLDAVECLDALCDLLYFTLGLAVHASVQTEAQQDTEYTLIKLKQDSQDDLFDWKIFEENVSDAIIGLEDEIRSRNVPLFGVYLSHIIKAVFHSVTSFSFESIFFEAFKEVHRSNMSKLDENGKPIFREDGKILKSNLYSPPNLKPFIERLRNESK